MSFSRSDIEHLARLSRLRLSGEEQNRFLRDLSDILSYIGQLSEVDIGSVSSMIGATDFTNHVREDLVSRDAGSIVRTRFISLAPEHTDEYIETISPFGENNK